MEFLFLFVLVVFIGINHHMHSGLSQRVSELEQEVDMLRRKGRSDSTRSDIQVPLPSYANQPTRSSATQQLYTSHDEMREPESVENGGDEQSHITQDSYNGEAFVNWLQKDLLMKIGALFLLMGLGWFVSYAFMHDWIGEVGRITLGLLLGAGIMALGAWRIRRYEHQGAIFTVLGSSTILLTVFAARVQYDMFDKLSALGLMFLSVLFVTFVSLKYHRNSLALASLVLAALAPYFTAAPPSNINDHFLYILVVVLGTLWVVYKTGWRNLTLAALIMVALTTSPYMVDHDDRTLALLWSFVFTGIFFIGNIVSLIRQRGGITSETNLFTAAGTALFLVTWVFAAAQEETRSLLLVAWMLVFAFGAYLVFRCTNVRSPFYVYGATSIGLLGAATAAELDGAVLTICLTLEVAGLLLAASVLKLERRVIQSLCVLFAIPIGLSFESIFSSAWRYGILHSDFFNLVILTLVLLIVGLFLIEQDSDTKSREMRPGGVLVTVGVVYTLTLLWLVLHAFFRTNEDLATMLTLIIYTVIGIGFFYTGKKDHSDSLRLGGAMLLGLVVLRLLLVDVWNMELTGKIITFLAIGVLLISTAFLSKSGDTKST